MSISFLSLFYIQQSKTGNFYIFVINNNQNFVSQILTVLSAFGEKFNFFDPLGFEAKSDFDHKTTKIKSYSGPVHTYPDNYYLILSEESFIDRNSIHTYLDRLPILFTRSRIRFLSRTNFMRIGLAFTHILPYPTWTGCSHVSGLGELFTG